MKQDNVEFKSQQQDLQRFLAKQFNITKFTREKEADE
jgi:hypothetical protein